VHSEHRPLILLQSTASSLDGRQRPRAGCVLLGSAFGERVGSGDLDDAVPSGPGRGVWPDSTVGVGVPSRLVVDESVLADVGRAVGGTAPESAAVPGENGLDMPGGSGKGCIIGSWSRVVKATMPSAASSAATPANALGVNSRSLRRCRGRPGRSGNSLRIVAFPARSAAHVIGRQCGLATHRGQKWVRTHRAGGLGGNRWR
jgi:hypothetical protein